MSRPYRYERKCFISNLTMMELEMTVRQHPALFREIYHPRYVNNFYLDSSDLTCFFDNVNGVVERTKVRVRWYGEVLGEVQSPVLELKKKKGFVGTKESFPLPPFSIKPGFSTEIVTNAVQHSEAHPLVKEEVRRMQVVLCNRYRRKYFMSADQNFRITIDSEMEYYRLHNSNIHFENQHVDRENLILEIKYAEAFDSEAEHITNYFPFPITKSSKYVTGALQV